MFNEQIIKLFNSENFEELDKLVSSLDPNILAEELQKID